MIQRLGTAIESAIRSVDVAARLSGDEFGILLFGSSENEAHAVIARIATAFEGLGHDGPLATFTAGVAHRRTGSTKTLDDLLRDADMTMYAHKAPRRPTALEAARWSRARDRDELP